MLSPLLKISDNLSFLSSTNNINRCAKPPASVTVSDTDIALNPNSNILIAEDNKVSADLMKAMIESMGINKITIVNDGKEAIEMILSNIKFDLLILDIMMPGINGLDVLKELRREGNNRRSAQAHCNFPIMIISALTDSQTVAKGIEMGANDYMVKPISKDTFKAKVAFLINQKLKDE